MLPNIIAWDEDSHHIIYSSIHGEKRKLWSLDSISELNKPVKFYEGEWFELETINAEQVLIHFWGEGIYLYDTKKQHAQKLVDPEKCKTFNYIHESKKIIFNNNDDYFFFDPKTKRTDLLCKNALEMIIDSKHKTFITISADLNNQLVIYYKNSNVYKVKKAIGIYCDSAFANCYYFVEDSDLEKTTLYSINLDQLKSSQLDQLNGLLQSANLVEEQLFLNLNYDGYYYFYIYDTKLNKLELLQHIRSDNPVYAQLSPNGKKIAYIMEDEAKSELQVHEIT